MRGETSWQRSERHRRDYDEQDALSVGAVTVEEVEEAELFARFDEAE